MRIDDFLSSVGVIKRRTIAKELGANGMIAVNGRAIKPAYQVKMGDIIHIKGTHSITIEVLNIPTGSIPKERRSLYFKEV
jgi:ribosomal 50S subunit-recycling heat shock protein